MEEFVCAAVEVIRGDDLVARLRYREKCRADGCQAGSNGNGCWMAEYSNRYVEIEPEDLYVTVEYDRFGESAYLVVPLPKEVTP